MRTPTGPLCGAFLAALTTAGCATTGVATPEEEPEPARLVGAATRQQIEAVHPEWVEDTVAARPDALLVSGLLEVEPAELTVYLGTWCSDSRRELARFWRGLDDLPFEPPLEIRYVAVDRAMREPRELLAGVDLRYVPTFVVARDGREIGRVIEEAPTGIEADLLELLTGQSAGWISARQDLAPPASETER